MGMRVEGVGLPRHGGPEDRGGADAYYGRPMSAHYFIGRTELSPKVTYLTEEEIADYVRGYNTCTERKDWG